MGVSAKRLAVQFSAFAMLARALPVYSAPSWTLSSPPRTCNCKAHGHENSIQCIEGEDYWILNADRQFLAVQGKAHLLRYFGPDCRELWSRDQRPRNITAGEISSDGSRLWVRSEWTLEEEQPRADLFVFTSTGGVVREFNGVEAWGGEMNLSPNGRYSIIPRLGGTGQKSLHAAADSKTGDVHLYEFDALKTDFDNFWNRDRMSIDDDGEFRVFRGTVTVHEFKFSN